MDQGTLAGKYQYSIMLRIEGPKDTWQCSPEVAPFRVTVKFSPNHCSPVLFPQSSDICKTLAYFTGLVSLQPASCLFSALSTTLYDQYLNCYYDVPMQVVGHESFIIVRPLTMMEDYMRSYGRSTKR